MNTRPGARSYAAMLLYKKERIWKKILSRSRVLSSRRNDATTSRSGERSLSRHPDGSHRGDAMKCPVARETDEKPPVPITRFTANPISELPPDRELLNATPLVSLDNPVTSIRQTSEPNVARRKCRPVKTRDPHGKFYVFIVSDGTDRSLITAGPVPPTIDPIVPQGSSRSRRR